MSERYLVTGVQLGLLIALPDQKQRQDIVEDIVKDQFLGRSENDVFEDVGAISRTLKLDGGRE